jgi:hypothetical protein
MDPIVPPQIKKKGGAKKKKYFKKSMQALEKELQPIQSAPREYRPRHRRPQTAKTSNIEK